MNESFFIMSSGARTIGLCVVTFVCYKIFGSDDAIAFENSLDEYHFLYVLMTNKAWPFIENALVLTSPLC